MNAQPVTCRQRFANDLTAGRAAFAFVEMMVMSKGHEAQLRNLIVGYGDSIYVSADIKANIAVLSRRHHDGNGPAVSRPIPPVFERSGAFGASSIIIFFNLLASGYPRFPRAGRRRFPDLAPFRPGGL